MTIPGAFNDEADHIVHRWWRRTNVTRSRGSDDER